jgi:hypothetical protein
MCTTRVACTRTSLCATNIDERDISSTKLKSDDLDIVYHSESEDSSRGVWTKCEIQWRQMKRSPCAVSYTNLYLNALLQSGQFWIFSWILIELICCNLDGIATVHENHPVFLRKLCTTHVGRLTLPCFKIGLQLCTSCMAAYRFTNLS